MSFRGQSLDNILKTIEDAWQTSGVSTDFIGLMHRMLPRDLKEPSLTAKGPARWALLPGLCCQAAGGDPRWADELAAAWFLFYLAAHMMDSVEDQDSLKNGLPEMNSGEIINLASGLYFSASLILSNLSRQKQTATIYEDLLGNLYRGFLHMCSGQQQDLADPEPGLADYWKSTRERSGAFFSIACRLGARIGTADQSKLAGYDEFGQELGILIQILDDLEEFQDSDWILGKSSYGVLRRSLPVIYALDVYPAQKAETLRLELQKSSMDIAAAKSAFKRIEASGVVIYVLTELERHRSMARRSLKQAQPAPEAEKLLVSLLESLTLQT